MQTIYELDEDYVAQSEADSFLFSPDNMYDLTDAFQNFAQIN
jgi:hypothetical protein